MWVPRTAEDLRNGLGDVQETAVVDFKKDLPPPGKNASIAVDVAAMSTDGGTIIYGVAEDKAKMTLTPTPIRLAGTVERITNVVSSSVGGWIEFEVIALDESSGVGFLVVAVPPSPLAPHFVDGRAYGRGPGGNVILGQGGIDRLYERRERWQRDAEVSLDEAIDSSPFRPDLVGGPRGVLHLVVHPLLADKQLRERAWPAEEKSRLVDALVGAHKAVTFSHAVKPDLMDLINGTFSRTFGGVAFLHRPTFPMWWQYLEVTDDGTVRYTYGGAATVDEQSGRFMIHDTAAAQTTVRILCLAGTLLTQGGYQGPIDIGSALLGCEGAISDEWIPPRAFPPFQIPGGLPTVPSGTPIRHSRRVMTSNLLDMQGFLEAGRSQIDPILRLVRAPSLGDPLVVV